MYILLLFASNLKSYETVAKFPAKHYYLDTWKLSGLPIPSFGERHFYQKNYFLCKIFDDKTTFLEIDFEDILICSRNPDHIGVHVKSAKVIVPM